MAFTTVGDIYEVSFRVSKKLNGQWVPDPAGFHGKQNVVATSDQNAMTIVQGFMGHDGTTVMVNCHGGIRKVMSGVIIAA